MDIKATLNNMTVAELRKLAGQFHITGRSTMKKAELIRELSDPDISDVVELSISIAETDEITAEPETMSAIAEAEAETVAEQADAETGDLLDAALGEYVEPTGSHGTVAITKYNAHAAIATVAFGDGSTMGGHVTRGLGGRWALMYGPGHVIRAKTLGKAAKLWAKRIGLVDAKIDVASMS